MLVENKTGLVLIMCRYCVPSLQFTSDKLLLPHNQEVFEGPPFTPSRIICHEDVTNYANAEFYISPGNMVVYWDPKKRNCLIVRYYQDELPHHDSLLLLGHY